MYKIVDDSSGEILGEYGTLFEAERMLCYFLNHDHDAYIMTSDN